ncbi:hypothetical protein BGZ49_006546 [Haplosporangium sp. Z 27]|nr:hypothetical protein BGZ49_006546 [Haplosporangium sp. Z 27]
MTSPINDKTVLGESSSNSNTGGDKQELDEHITIEVLDERPQSSCTFGDKHEPDNRDSSCTFVEKQIPNNRPFSSCTMVEKLNPDERLYAIEGKKDQDEEPHKSHTAEGKQELDEKSSDSPDNGSSSLVDSDSDEESPIPESNVTKVDDQIYYKPTPNRFRVIMTALTFCVFLSSLDQIIILTSIPAISREFGALGDVSWIGTAYLLTMTTCQPLYGKFSDIFGRKSAILFANVLFLAGSAISGWATSMNMLIIGRGVSGVGAGGLIPMAFIIISDMMDMRERSKYIGSITGVHAFSSVVGPLLGGTFVDHATWRWSFWINLPIVTVSIIVLAIFLDIPVPKGSLREKLRRIDYLGAPTLMASVVLFLVPFSWAGSKYEWSNPIIIGMICGGVIFAILFILVEWKIPREPIVPIHLYKIRNLWVTYAMSFFSGMSYFGILFYTPIYFQVVKGESATIGGLEIVPFVVGLAFASVFAGVWANKKGTYLFFIPLGCFIFVVGASLCILFKANSPRIIPIVTFLICGLGMGFLMQTATLAVQAAAKPKYMATVTALVPFMRSLGQVFGISVLGAIFNNKLTSSLESAFPGDPSISIVAQNYDYIATYPPVEIAQIFNCFVSALHYAFYSCSAFCAVAFILSLFLKHKILRNKSDLSNFAQTPDIA